MEEANSNIISVLGAKPEIISARGGEELKLVLGEFAGPLDLLLYLIRQEQVSIYDIPVARITDAYLGYLRLMQEMDIAVATDFIVMAATLIEIVSHASASGPTTANSQDDESLDPRRELVDRLIEHQKYKAASQMLWSRAIVEHAVFTRGPLDTDKQNPEISVGVFDLLRKFQEIIARRKEEAMMEIERDEMTQAEMLERLKNMVFSSGELNLRTFFELSRSRRELVLAFLSILELVRTAEVILIQQETFGDIIARVSN